MYRAVWLSGKEVEQAMEEIAMCGCIQMCVKPPLLIRAKCICVTRIKLQL